MRLARLRLRNFRCFRDEVAIDFDDVTALVGKNDSGKSSIMDALDIFLNGNAPDSDDASLSGDRSDLTIVCEFVDLPEELVLDDANPTTLEDEYLLNEDGRLEIHKTYSGNLKTPKCTSVAAWACHPTADGVADLLQLTIGQLKERAEVLGASLEEVDTRVNAELRARIREHVGELAPAAVKVPLNEDNARKAWTGLSNYLPAFALFRSDRESTDQDPEAQDPMKAAVQEAVKAKETELRDIAEYVKAEVQKIAEATLQKLQEMDPTLATELKPV